MSSFVGSVRNATAFVDTNARRVLHRLFLGVDVPEPFATERDLQRLAETMVPRGRGWKWGQSVIEFGASQCTARKPLCESCPLSDLCAARPTIWGALTRLPRAEKPAYRYEGSNRYYRGRVLAALRQTSEESIPLIEFNTILREDFGDEDLPWLYSVVKSLEKERRTRPDLIHRGSAAEGSRGTRSLRERKAGRHALRDRVRKPALKIPGCRGYLPISGSKSSAAELMQ